MTKREYAVSGTCRYVGYGARVQDGGRRISFIAGLKPFAQKNEGQGIDFEEASGLGDPVLIGSRADSVGLHDYACLLPADAQAFAAPTRSRITRWAAPRWPPGALEPLGSVRLKGEAVCNREMVGGFNVGGTYA